MPVNKCLQLTDSCSAELIKFLTVRYFLKEPLKTFQAKKGEENSLKEDQDYAQKVEKIITDLSPEERRISVWSQKC